MSGYLLEAIELRKHFTLKKGLFSREQASVVKAVDGINFQVHPGDVFGIVGESGCGKTTVLKMILLLMELTSGELRFEGNDITKMDRPEIKQYKKKVQTVLQDPYASLSPRLKIKDIIREPMEINLNLTKREMNERVKELLESVQLGADAAEYYPHEFSGGQRQRIAIARSMSINPELVLLDEPVSALDVSVQGQLMNLLMDLRQEHALTYIIVAHNLAVIRYMCNRVMVMYLGKIVEYGDSEEIFDNQLHPYTQALFAAAMPPDPDLAKDMKIIEGELPSPINLPKGCRFHTRCPFATGICSEVEPRNELAGKDHLVMCHHWRKFAK